LLEVKVKVFLLLAILIFIPRGMLHADPLNLLPEGIDPLPPSVGSGNLLFVTDTASNTHIISSFQHSTGLYALNQASGSLNDQFNCFLLVFGEVDFAEMGGYIASEREGDFAAVKNAESRDLIVDSFWSSRGVFLLNQSAGNLNIQGNALLLSIGPQALVLEDLELGAQRPEGETRLLEEVQGKREDLLLDSFNGALGVGLISQSAGNMNTIHNALGISFSHQVIR